MLPRDLPRSQAPIQGQIQFGPLVGTRRSFQTRRSCIREEDELYTEQPLSTVDHVQIRSNMCSRISHSDVIPVTISSREITPLT